MTLLKIFRSNPRIFLSLQRTISSDASAAVPNPRTLSSLFSGPPRNPPKFPNSAKPSPKEKTPLSSNFTKKPIRNGKLPNNDSKRVEPLEEREFPRELYPEAATLVGRLIEDGYLKNANFAKGEQLEPHQIPPTQYSRHFLKTAAERFGREHQEIAKMEDENGSQNEIDKRRKKPRKDYFTWSEDMADELLRLLVIEVKKGNRRNNGNFKRAIVEENVIPVLKEKFGKDFTYDSIRHKILSWKRNIAYVETLMKNNSGFGWDATTQRFTYAEDIWQDYIKARLGAPSRKDKIFLRFDEYRMVARNHEASSKNAGGLGFEGVEDARSANARCGIGDDSLEESVVVDDDARSEIPNDMPPPTDTIAPPYMPETIPCTSSSKRHHRIPSGVEAQSMVDKSANEFSDLNAYVAKLVAMYTRLRV